jgi:cytochrome c oxidase subunit 2
VITAIVLIALASLWVGQHSGWLMPAGASREAESIDAVFTFMLGTAAAIFFGVQGALLYSAIFFRRARTDMSDGPHTHGNLNLEILWTVVPTVLMLYLAIYSFEIYQQLGATAPMEAAHPHPLTERQKAAATRSGAAPLVVEVQAQQFAWVFRYPEKNIETAELHLPVDRPVVLKMRSEDVIHGFWVPEFRLKQDVIPGRTTTLRFEPSRVGKYALRCTQLCGAYHGGMVSEVYVDSPKDYETWLTSQAALPEATRLARLRDPRVPTDLLSQAPLGNEQTRALQAHLRTQEQ